MNIKLEFKDIYGQEIISLPGDRIIFNLVKDPRSREDLYYRLSTNRDYSKVSKLQYELMKEFIQEEAEELKMVESISYIFRGRVDDDTIIDKAREIYLGEDNYDRLCLKLSLDQEVSSSYVFEDKGEDIILQEEDYPIIHQIIQEFKKQEELLEEDNENEFEEGSEQIILEDEVNETIDEDDSDSGKTSISDFINNLKSESLSKAINNKKSKK